MHIAAIVKGDEKAAIQKDQDRIPYTILSISSLDRL